MKATAWLCPVLTLLCAIQLVYTAQRGNYGSYHPAMDGMDSNAIQNDYFLSKRNKPSLSIVNPLDVLRQRLLLEIARRQMKENTRQVELNRAILKNVGKRMLNKHPHPLLPTFEQQWMDAGLAHSQSQRHQLNAADDGDMQRDSMAMQPYDDDLELIPSTLIFDYLQQQRRPWLANDRRTSMSFDNYDDENVNGAMDDLDVVGDGIKLAFQPMVVAANGQSDERHETTMKKPINLGGHEGEPKESLLSSLKHHKNNDFKLNDLATLALNEGSNGRNDNSDDNGGNANTNSNNKNSVTSNKNGINDDNQVERYLYHLHKNHLTRK